jgi:hypothetical protein
MTEDLSAEATTIIATYSSRRDAEMAQDHLDGEGLRAFIRADDAGGMHPQLQQSHGVKLVVLQRAAPDAYDLLDDAGLLPADAHRPPEIDSAAASESRPPSRAFTIAVAAFVIVVTALGVFFAFVL